MSCPFHDDRNPSASVLFKEGSPVALYCFGPCARGGRFARFPVVEAERRGDGWLLRLGGAAALRAGPRRRKGPAPSEARGADDFALVSRPAVSAATRLAREQMDAGQANPTRWLAAWEVFLRAKRIPVDPKAISALPYAPIFLTVAIAYPLLCLSCEQPPLPRYHLRLVAGGKGLFHPSGTSDGQVWSYAPRGFRESSDVVIVEAPHQALRISLLVERVLPIAALGISNIRAVSSAISHRSRIIAVFTDEPAVDIPGAIALDLDEVENERLISLIRSRMRNWTER